jgi:osmotically-inducible protein OsmY
MEENPILQEKIENGVESTLKINNIYITVLGQNVTLKGIVNSYDEKDKVESIAWNTSGVLSVNNELSICNEN